MKIYSLYCSDRYVYWRTKNLQCGAELRASLLSSSIDEFTPVSNLEIVKDEEWGDIAAVEMSCVTISISSKMLSIVGSDLKTVPIAGDSNYHMVIPSVVDALNFDKSVVTTFPNSRRVLSIKKYVFDTNKITQFPLFLLPYGPTSILATEEFVVKCKVNNFKGIEFKKIYEE